MRNTVVPALGWVCVTLGACFSNPTPHPAADAGFLRDVSTAGPDDGPAENGTDIVFTDTSPTPEDVCSSDDIDGGCDHDGADTGWVDGEDSDIDSMPDTGGDTGPTPAE